MKLFLSQLVSVCMVSVTEEKPWQKEAEFSDENNVDKFQHYQNIVGKFLVLVIFSFHVDFVMVKPSSPSN